MKCSLPVKIYRPGATLSEDLDSILQDKLLLTWPDWHYYNARRGSREQTNAPGTTIVDTGRVLSLRGMEFGQVKEGDIAVLPPTLGNERLRIVHVRPYRSGLQCDVVSGNVDTEANTG